MQNRRGRCKPGARGPSCPTQRRKGRRERTCLRGVKCDTLGHELGASLPARSRAQVLSWQEDAGRVRLGGAYLAVQISGVYFRSKNQYENHTEESRMTTVRTEKEKGNHSWRVQPEQRSHILQVRALPLPLQLFSSIKHTHSGEREGGEYWILKLKSKNCFI